MWYSGCMRLSGFMWGSGKKWGKVVKSGEMWGKVAKVAKSKEKWSKVDTDKQTECLVLVRTLCNIIHMKQVFRECQILQSPRHYVYK